MSKVCPQCGKELADSAMFCNECGAKLVESNNNASYESAQTTNNYANNNQSTNTMRNAESSRSTLIVDPSEKIQAELKNSAALTFLVGGGLAKSRLFFTNERVYFQGKRFSLRSLGMNTSDVVVDLRDISATKIVHKNPIVFLIIAIIASLWTGANVMQDSPFGGFFLLLLLLAISVFIYFAMKDTYIALSYPGGESRLSVKMYNYQDILSFHKLLRRKIG